MPVMTNKLNSLAGRCATVALSAIALLALAQPTQAARMALGVDSAQSNFTAKLTFFADIPLLGHYDLSTPAVNATPQGAAPAINAVPPATLGFLGDLLTSGPQPGTPGQLTSLGGGFTFIDVVQTLNGPNIPFVGGGSVTLGLVAPHITIANGDSFLPVAAGVGTGTYDFGGLDLTLSGGNFSYSSSGYLNFIGSDSINFLTDAATVTLPSGSLGSIALGNGPPGAQPVTLTLPLNVTVPLFSVGDTTLGAGINAVFGGTVVFTGILVPEPGSIVLLGVGLCAALPLVRRMKRRSA